MYFADWDGRSSLERAYLDGTNRKTLLRPGRIKGLTIDYYEGRLYWANLDKPTIESSDMLGKLKECLIVMTRSRFDINHGEVSY